MELNEKLQELRKQKEMTQEELAEQLFVSRAAISKWESGRGYPSIDSLKAISRFFEISIDELLSSDELLMIAEEDTKHKENNIRDLVFGLLDIGIASFFILPLFGQNLNGIIQEVSLLSLTETALYLRVLYFVFVISVSLFGIASLALQNNHQPIWVRNKNRISFVFNSLGVVLFIMSKQPYAAIMLFMFLLIKGLMLVKR